MDLLQKTGVLLAPGSGFGEAFGSGHFRMVFLPPIEQLEVALNKIERFISCNKQRENGR
jgi:alanine-synthesizing transaminase